MTDAKLKELLDAIGPEAEEDDNVDPRWEQLALGELVDEEVRRLRVEAGVSPQAKLASELFAPLPLDVVNRTADRLLAMRARDLAAASVEPAAPLVHEPEAAELVPAPANTPPVVQAPPARTTVPAEGLMARVLRSMSRPAVWAPLMLVAAAAIFAVRLPSTPELPSYEMSVTGLKATRGSDLQAGPAVAKVGGAFQVVLTPEDEVAGGIHAGAFYEAGGQLVPATWELAVSASGGAKAKVVAGDQVGTKALVVVVLPGAGEVTLSEAQAAVAGKLPSARVQRYQVEVVP